MRNFSKGFGVVGVIILIFVLALLGFGGYTGYQYATNPTFDFYGFVKKTPAFIPQGLVDLVDGKNAEGILAYQSDHKLSLKIDELLANYKDLPLKGSDVQAALAAGLSPESAGNEDGAFIAAVQFSSPEKARTVRDSVAFFATFARIAVELSDNTVMFKMHPELLEGSILENPLLKKGDPAWYDSQLAFLVDTSKAKTFSGSAGLFFSTIPGATDIPVTDENMLSVMIPSARAQVLISPSDQPGRLAEATSSSPDPATSGALAGYFTNFMEGYARIHENTLDVHFAMDFVDRSDLKTIVIPSAVSTESIETLYDASLKSLDTVIQNANTSLQKPEALTNFKLDRVGLKFLADATIDLTKIEPLPDPAVEARDVSRKADLNMLMTAIEIYDADTGSYPSESQCIQDLKSDISNNLLHGMPVDPKGSQTFGSIVCPYGYYYQYFGGNTYALWAHMEDEKNGNTDWPLVIESPADIVKVEGGTSGPYYVLVQGSGNLTTQELESQQLASESQETLSLTQESSETQPVVRKVKRVTNPPASTQELVP